MQTRLWQSTAEEHVELVPHGGHEPPQSTSVSEPFFVRSRQVSTMQAPLRHWLPEGQLTPTQATSTQVAFTHAWAAPHVCIAQLVGKHWPVGPAQTWPMAQVAPKHARSKQKPDRHTWLAAHMVLPQLRG